MSEQQMPLCAVHESLDKSDELVLHIGNGCVACSLNERNELLEMLTPFADGDSVQSLFRLIEKHTVLLAVADAAEEYKALKGIEFEPCATCSHELFFHGFACCDGDGEECNCDEFVSELEQKLSAWRKQV